MIFYLLETGAFDNNEQDGERVNSHCALFSKLSRDPKSRI